MTMAIALYKGKASILGLIKDWFWSWIGNFVGGALFAYLFAYVTSPGQNDTKTPDAWVTGIRALAKSKTHYEWHVIILKGIACNYVVCLCLYTFFQFFLF